MPRKKKEPARSPRVKKRALPKRPRKPKLNPIMNEQTTKCLKWMESQKKIKTDNLPNNTDDLVPPSSDEDFSEEVIKARVMKKNLFAKENMLVNYSCDWGKCNKEYADEQDYKNHILGHVANPELCKIGDNYECAWDLCHFQTQDKAHFFRHVMYHEYHSRLLTIGDMYRRNQNIPACFLESRNRNNIPELPNDFFCFWDDCTAKFNIISDYIGHVKHHIANEHYDMFLEIELKKKKKNPRGSFKAQPLKCQWANCKIPIASRTLLLRHIRSHTNEKTIACDQCGISFHGTSGIIEHCTRQKLSNDINYQCTQCSKFFPTEQLLTKHFKQHINCHKCQFCDMTVPTKAHLVKHIRYRHLKDRPFKCPQCEYRAVVKRDLDLHMCIHEQNSEEEYECQDCDHVSSTLRALRHHFRLKHSNLQPNVYGCHVCERRFTRGDNMSKHLRNIHGFQLPPGCSRFIYRMDEDYVHRVQMMRIESLEVSKQILSKKRTKAPVLNETDIDIDVMGMGANGLDVKVKIPKLKSGGGEPKVTAKGRKRPKADTIEIIAELPQLKDLYPSQDDQDSAKLKSIDNFMVMRKYIKDPVTTSKKNIEITFAEVDKDGNVINNQTIDADEILLN